MRLVIEGIDKTGKDLLLKYIDQLSGHTVDIQSRSILSMLAYNEIFDRKKIYDIEDYRDIVIIYLTADEEDLAIRFKCSNEPEIDRAKHKAVFDKYADYLEEKGFIVRRFNTSEMTPYKISKVILEELRELGIYLY